jgi:transposase
MDTTNSETIEVKNLDHLGLVAGMIDSLGLVAEIDRLIPCERKVSVGLAVKALIMNAMGFSQHALYITPEFFERCPVKHLLGASYESSDFNDDSLGRSLDDLFDYGLSKIFVHLAHQSCLSSGIDTRYWHVDSTNFSVEGSYSEEGEGVKIAHGYAKDKRTDLKQVTLGLITSYKTSIPRYMQPFDGNSSDQQTLSKMIEEFVSCFEQGEDPGTFIADAGIYSAENLTGVLSKVGWISRVPETIGLAKEEIDKTKDSDLTMGVALEGYRFRSLQSTYAGVAQRWLVVESEPLAKAAHKTMKQKMEHEQQQVRSKIEKKEKKWFKQLAEIKNFMTELEKKHPYISIQYSIREQFGYSKAGKPKAENRVVKYQIETFEVNPKEEVIAAAIKQKSRFILATNELNTERLTDEEILKAYKTQATSVENGFKFLKDPVFFAESFFVKKTSRLEGLLMIMALSLLVYALCERKLLTELADKNEFVNTQTAKTTQKPTMRMIFNQFRGIQLVKLNDKDNPFCTNLNDNHKKIIRLLGPAFAKYYFLRI